MYEISLAKGLLYGAKTGADLYRLWKERRRDRDQRRLHAVQTYLRSRVDNIEETVDQLSEADVDCDLFMSVLNSLIQDDEERKVPYYAAFLEYFLTKNSHDVSDRLVAEAIKTLTADELQHLAVYETEKARAAPPPDWLEVRFPTRLQSLGLSIDASHSAYETRLTSVGKIVQKVVQAAPAECRNETE